MWKSLTPATAIALVMGLGACANMEGPLTFIPQPSESVTKPSLIPDRQDISNEMRLADASLKAGDAATAISMYRRLARDYPLAMSPRIALGDALLAANAAQEAERAYMGALKLNGDSHKALTGLGRVELALHKPAEALLYFDRAARERPGDTQAHNGRAVALDQLGHHDEAQAIYLDLLQHDPSNIRVRNNYALSLALAGKYDESSDILTSLAAAPDSGARVRQNLALVYGLAGNDGQAAHVARMDLDEEAVNNNLQYFQRLRHEESPIVKGAALLNPSDEPAMSPPPAKKKMHKSEALPETPSTPVAQADTVPVTPVARIETTPASVITPPTETREVATLPATPAKETTARAHSYFSFFGASNKPADVPAAPAFAQAAEAEPQSVASVAAPAKPAPQAQAEVKAHTAPPAAASVAAPQTISSKSVASVAPAQKTAAVTAPAIAAPKETAAKASKAAPLPVETALTAADLKPKIEAHVAAPIARAPAPVQKTASSASVNHTAHAAKPAPVRKAAAVPAVTVDPDADILAQPPATTATAIPVSVPEIAPAPKATPTAEANPVEVRAQPVEVSTLPQASRSPAVPAVAPAGQGVSASVHPKHHHAQASPARAASPAPGFAEAVKRPAVPAPRG